MKRFEWSRPAFLIGFVLAKPIEKKFNVLVQNIRNDIRVAEREAGEPLNLFDRIWSIEGIDLYPMIIIGILIIGVVIIGILMSLAEAREARQNTHNIDGNNDQGPVPWRLKRQPLLFLGLVVLIFAYMAFAPLNMGGKYL